MYWYSLPKLDKPIQRRFKLRNLKRFLFYRGFYSMERIEKGVSAILNSIYKKSNHFLLENDCFVEVPGFEPGTLCSQNRCANRAALHLECFRECFVLKSECKGKAIFLICKVCRIFFQKKVCEVSLCFNFTLLLHQRNKHIYTFYNYVQKTDLRRAKISECR